MGIHKRVKKVDIHAVCILDRGQMVGNGSGHAALGSLAECSLDNLLRSRVKHRGRLIEEQHLGIPEQHAGDGNTLLLATRELRALATYMSVEAVWEGLDELEDVCVVTGLLNLLLCDLLNGLDGAKKDVKPDGAGVECGLLRDKGDLLAVLIDIGPRDRLLVKLYGCRDQ